MKNSFNLLVNIQKERVIEMLGQQTIFSEITIFLKQLSNDYQRYIAQKGYDPIKQAENWLKITYALERRHPYLSEASQEKLDLLNDLLTTYGTSTLERKGALIAMEMYQSLDTVLHRDKRTFIIQSVVRDYIDYLKKEIEEQQINLNTPITMIEYEQFTPIQRRLITKYKLLLVLNKQIVNKDSLDKDDIHLLKTILEHKFQWSERPFQQKLADVLSCGLRPIYREFFSKEALYTEVITRNLSTDENLQPCCVG